MALSLWNLSFNCEYPFHTLLEMMGSILRPQKHAKSMNSSLGVPISNAFDIISTVRYDPLLFHSEENTRINTTTLARMPIPFYMLSYHRDRMLASAKAFGWNPSPLEGPEAFEKLLDMLHDHLESEHSNRDFAPLMVRWADPRELGVSDSKS